MYIYNKLHYFFALKSEAQKKSCFYKCGTFKKSGKPSEKQYKISYSTSCVWYANKLNFSHSQQPTSYRNH